MSYKRLLFTLFLIFFVIHVSAQPNTRPQPDGTLRRIYVPILMYHYISPLPSDADDIRVELTVEPHLFRAHLQHLNSEGYRTISLYELDEALLTGKPLPEKPIILTFDDGHIDHYTYAFPALKDFGYTATFFIITGFADNNVSNHLSWKQIEEMATAGMSMEAHTKSHQDLRNRDHDYLVYEIAGSIESLTAHTGLPAHMFAYPGGKYDIFTLETIKRLPVWRAFTTENSAAHTTGNHLEMPRIRMSGNLSVTGLEFVLRNTKK
jgi:peptidoglycan/xylan/chitin deacetylase (PgdA/CDA1 family)